MNFYLKVYLGMKTLQKHHWPSLMSTFSSGLQEPFLVMFRHFLHILFVLDVDKDRGTLLNSEPQTPWLPIKHSLNFSQCYKYHEAIGGRIEIEKLE